MTDQSAAPSVDIAVTATDALRRYPIDGVPDGAGRSLYFFAQDTVGNPPTSACLGTAGDRTTCVGNWPIFLASTTVVPSNIDPAKITVFTRSSDNLQQSAFDGHPLYYFADDKVPGDDLGLTFPPGLGQWFNVDPAVQ